MGLIKKGGKIMKSKIFYTLLGLAVGLILSWDLLWAKSIDMTKAGVSLWVAFAVVIFVLLLEIIPTIIMLTSFLDYRKNSSGIAMNWKPVRIKSFSSLIGIIVGLILGVNVVWARSIDLSQAGVAFWIFLAIGLFIVLLQLIPAIIMFIALIGTMTKIVHEKIPVKEEETEEPAKEEAKV